MLTFARKSSVLGLLGIGWKTSEASRLYPRALRLFEALGLLWNQHGKQARSNESGRGGQVVLGQVSLPKHNFTPTEFKVYGLG